MKKKIFSLLLLVFMVLFVVGCGKKETDENNNDNTNNNNQTEVEEKTQNGNNTSYDEIELYSDDTKIVFKTEQGRAVYSYEGQKITDYRVYIDYTTPSNANIALSVLNQEENETIESAHVEGRYLVIVYKKSTYESFTVDTLRMVYSYLEEMKKQ